MMAADEPMVVEVKEDIVAKGMKSCPNCWYKTSDRLSMQRHLRVAHPKVKTHKCPMPNCDFSTDRKDRMASHVMVSWLEES